MIVLSLCPGKEIMMNLKKASILILVMIFPLMVYVIAAWANSASSFRCRGRLVRTGDPEYVVKSKCGKPTSEQEMGNVWVYDFGPQRFIYYVKFSDGAVFRIYTGGYGR